MLHLALSRAGWTHGRLHKEMGPGQGGGRELRGSPCTPPEPRSEKVLPAPSSARGLLDADVAATTDRATFPRKTPTLPVARMGANTSRPQQREAGDSLVPRLKL